MKEVIRTPFYYGWVIVILAALSQFFSGPGQTYSNAIFINYYIDEFGWSRSMVSGIYSAATLLAGFLLFSIGRLIDSGGARKMSVIISLCLAAACFLNSFVINAFMLFIGFFMIRLLGQGSMTLLSNSLVPQWFIRKRGRALSTAALGGLISSAAFPILNVWLIDSFGWRSSWQVLGVLVAVIFAPLAFLFIRNKPEEIGLLPDNNLIVTTIENQAATTPADISWTVKEAMGTRAFWLLLFCVAIPAMVNTGLTFHLVSIFAEKSLSPEAAAAILSIMALIGFPVTFLVGFLLERMKVQYMLVIIFVSEIISLYLLQQVSLFHTAIIFGVIWGINVGMERITTGIVWPNYFGRAHLGGMSGISMSMVVIGSALGPLPFGLAFDQLGGYKEILWGMILFPALGIIAALLARPPQKTL
ncbi:MFS transporter [Bacillus atrophaeus]|uniref:MFS transporter n=1 Tax=Bacillus atrophaeus TaxID=1452 RepID=UPI001EFA9C44|nr:MFS transporter [Bacillus atrophaeus]MCG8398123.1 MFS transporter [Bacillus atrophaeus]